MNIDRALSSEIAARLRPRPRNQECGPNSFRALTELASGYSYDSLRYVEGWTSGLLRCWHAWVTTPDGRIVDVTPAYLDGAHDYEAVRIYAPTEVLAHLTRRGAKLPIADAATIRSLALEDGRRRALLSEVGRALEQLAAGRLSPGIMSAGPTPQT